MDIIGLEVVTGPRPIQKADSGSRISVSPPGKLILTFGDVCRLQVQFEYQGPARSLTLYGSIGNQGWGFNEIISTEWVFEVPSSDLFTIRQASVDIPISSAIAAGTNYDLMAKIKEYPQQENRVQDVIDIVGISPKFELIEDRVYPFAYIYDGDAEITTAEYQTDPFTPSGWNADNFADKLEEEIRAQGGRPLGVKVWVDVSPLLWTNFKVEATYVPGLESVSSSGITGTIAFWPAIGAVIVYALAIIGIIVAITLAITTVAGLFKHKPALEAAKQAWSKETLILTVQDAEEYWERPKTPPEDLAAMSEAEVREFLDQIAEIEIPPTTTWWPLAVGAGIAILGIGYGLMKKPRS